MDKKIIIVLAVIIAMVVLNACTKKTESTDGKINENRLVGALWQRNDNGILIYALKGKHMGELIEIETEKDLNNLEIGDLIECIGKYTEDNKFKIESFELKAENKNYKGNINKAEEVIEKSDFAVLIDVRTTSEFKSGHLPNATNIVLDQIEDGVEDIVKDKATPILVYCRSGARSGSAMAILNDMGYKMVVNVGGISSYKGDIEKE